MEGEAKGVFLLYLPLGDTGRTVPCQSSEFQAVWPVQATPLGHPSGGAMGLGAMPGVSSAPG